MIPRLSIEDFCTILKLYKYNEENCKNLFRKIRENNVDCFLNYGSKVYGDLRVVGAGFAGVLFLALSARGVVLVKILRKDSRRNSMIHECNILRIASRIGVSPRVYGCDDDYIIMEYIDGYHLVNYIENIEKLGYTYNPRIVLRSALYKAFLLDLNHIDHGELSRPYKHVLVSPKGIFIIDFDSASMSRKTRNLTSMLGGLFFRQNKFAETIRKNLGISSRVLKEVSVMIKDYKKHVDFNIVLGILEKLHIL